MHYYVLQSDVGSEAETSYEPVEPIQLGPAPTCPRCGRYVGLKAWLAPHSARVDAHGRRLGDVVFGSGTDLLVSDSFVSAWRSKGLRGLSGFETVDVRRVSASRVAGPRVRPYFHAKPERSEARVNRMTSQFTTAGSMECDLCLGPGPINAIVRLDLDLSSLSGEDAFEPWGSAGIVVVSERVLTLAREHLLENVTVIPLSTFRWDPLGRHSPPKQ